MRHNRAKIMAMLKSIMGEILAQSAQGSSHSPLHHRCHAAHAQAEIIYVHGFIVINFKRAEKFHRQAKWYHVTLYCTRYYAWPVR
jgi:hypothetical protein